MQEDPSQALKALRAPALLAVLAALALGAAPAHGAVDDPLFTFTPQPVVSDPPSPPVPPPNGYLNGPCGLAVGPGGRLYVSDHHHGAVDVFAPFGGSSLTYSGQLALPGSAPGPCGTALDSAGNLYVNRYHGEVRRYDPSPSFGAGATIDAGPATGVAVAPATGDVYVNNRTRISVYDSSGTHQLDLGGGSLGEAYGVAVSGFADTAGFVYVADAADGTVKVYDPSSDTANPVQTIDSGAPPAGAFASLRESALAVDDSSGDVYVVEDTQPDQAEQPRARILVFSSGGAYEGHLKRDVVHGAPTGIAVDNTGGATQGRVYVTSGNTHHGGIYVYPPNAATVAAPLAPTIPPVPLGGKSLFLTMSIGGPARGPDGISCEGDACQVLPAEPVAPTLTTRLSGLGNPPVRYRRALRSCRRPARPARRLSRRARARRCARGNRAGASAGVSSAPGASGAMSGAPDGLGLPRGPISDSPSRRAAVGASLAAVPAGFESAALAAAGGPAVLAGSHPYRLDFSVGLDQGAGQADLRRLRIDLPAGLLVNPSAVNFLCSQAQFETPRSSPFGASAAGESCPDRSQVGTVEVTRGAGAGETRRFGLFELADADGAAMRMGAAPFGVPLLLDALIRSGNEGPYVSLTADEIPEALQAEGLRISLWGVPWDASHNGARGDCLNEAEPAFPWAKCSVGEPQDSRPLAMLTLPTRCGGPLAFAAQASGWQGGDFEASAVNRDGEGAPAALADCGALGFESFDLQAHGQLTTRKASSSSGFVFRFGNEDPGLANPRARIRSHVEQARVELPDGVTLNPSLGAGLEACSPDQLQRESAFNPAGDGCPNGSKIGSFSIRSPFYKDFLRGSLYLAEPYDNPFDLLIAVYLVAKSADRGILLTAPGEIEADQADGTLTATFTGLPQLPYDELEVRARSGQRAPLVSPPRCGTATTRIELAPWARGPSQNSSTGSPVDTGIDAGPCPDASTPPFRPRAVAGGVNSNVGSYTPYFVHLIREDDEQEITSYSLTLPRGIVGKLAGIPFCPDAAIARARSRSGSDETTRPSCPDASQVGRTETGYGVGSALTYAPGRIYLAGPHNGQPLSLVTINAATVGPFDLGTVVIRSAFSVDPRTAQLAIDSRASDRIPHILDGVPLHLRDVRVHMDRPQFTRNPTGCEASQLVSSLTGSGRSFALPSDDSSAVATEHFQLLNCLELGFRPRLGLRLLGGARRGDYPGLRAVFRARGGDSDLERIAVTMPKSLFLAQNHIRTVCTRVQFAAEACPQGSVYGRAAAVTPLFDEPLTGPVLLRSSDNELPDLVASLRAGEVRIVLEGRVGPSQSGGVRAFFEGLPDAPVERFTMWLAGGRRGLLVNSVNICKASPQASVKALAHNNRGAIFTTKLRGQCKQAKDGRGEGGKGKRQSRGRGRGR